MGITLSKEKKNKIFLLFISEPLSSFQNVIVFEVWGIREWQTASMHVLIVVEIYYFIPLKTE